MKNTLFSVLLCICSLSLMESDSGGIKVTRGSSVSFISVQRGSPFSYFSSCDVRRLIIRYHRAGFWSMSCGIPFMLCTVIARVTANISGHPVSGHMEQMVHVWSGVST